MTSRAWLLVAACALAVTDSFAASVVSPVAATNAIQGPDLANSGAPARRPIWTLDVTRNAKGQLAWQYAAVDPSGKRLATFGRVDKARVQRP
jgi:hypothetical protein